MKNIYLFLLISLLFACSGNNENDLYFDGRLETDIIKISAITSGNLDSIFVDEGDVVEKGQVLALINTDRLKLQLQQQQAQLGEIKANNSSLNAQLSQLNSKLKLNENLIVKTKDLLQKGVRL